MWLTDSSVTCTDNIARLLQRSERGVEKSERERLLVHRASREKTLLSADGHTCFGVTPLELGTHALLTLIHAGSDKLRFDDVICT